LTDDSAEEVGASVGIILKDDSDGTGFAAITTTQTCDATFTQILIFEQSCASLRETTFQDWKSLRELEGIPVYEDPTAASVVIVLAPFKATLLFWYSSRGYCFWNDGRSRSPVTTPTREAR
jgi:hypothetical protein